MLSELDDYAHGQGEKKALVKNTNKSVCSAHFDGFSSDLVLETLTVGLYNMTHRKMKEIWFRFFFSSCSNTRAPRHCRVRPAINLSGI